MEAFHAQSLLSLSLTKHLLDILIHVEIALGA